MKSLLAVLALAAVIFPAQAEEIKEDAPKKKRPDPAKVFKKKNTNGDDHLTLEEFTKGAKDVERATKAFKRRDKDGDDKLTLEEFSAKPGPGKGKKKEGAE